MNDLELKAYDIKAGYVAWCRGEITKQQAEEAFDWFVRALKAEAWDEGYEAGSNDVEAHLAALHGHTDYDEYEDTPNPYRDK